MLGTFIILVNDYKGLFSQSSMTVRSTPPKAGGFIGRFFTPKKGPKMFLYFLNYVNYRLVSSKLLNDYAELGLANFKGTLLTTLSVFMTKLI